MNKIGIITLNGYFNYGNRLQNYALQEVLKNFDVEVETIWIESAKKVRKTELNRNLLNLKKLSRKLYMEIYLNPLRKKREDRFKLFSNQYIKESTYQISETSSPKQLEEFDYFVTGSDQVWNPYYIHSPSLYFLTFAPKSKRVAYAPSFGISELPEFCKEDYSKWLLEMNSLSVREEAGTEIISELTGRKAEVVADPTLLLTKESWLIVAKPASNKPKESYLLTYFLGVVTAEVKEKIDEYARKYKLKVVNLAQPKNKKYYLTNPSEFLDYINSATLFLTDSFHGTVFSILFETPFIVTDRKGNIPSMNSRIQTLLKTYKLENRHISKITEERLFDEEFSHIEDILKTEREKSINYLKNSFSKVK